MNIKGIRIFHSVIFRIPFKKRALPRMSPISPCLVGGEPVVRRSDGQGEGQSLADLKSMLQVEIGDGGAEMSRKRDSAGRFVPQVADSCPGSGRPQSGCLPLL